VRGGEKNNMVRGEGEVHVGVLKLVILCIDDSSSRDSSFEVDPDYIEELGLKPGDKVRYVEDRNTYAILGKIKEETIPLEVKTC